jgi:hypothetical protein
MPVSSSGLSGHGASDLSCGLRVDSANVFWEAAEIDFDISGDGEVLSVDLNHVTRKRLGSDLSCTSRVGETTVVLGADSFDATDVDQHLGAGSCCREEFHRDRLVELVDTVVPDSIRFRKRYISVQLLLSTFLHCALLRVRV